MTSSSISQPVTVKLKGGLLDGDCFELMPNGSIMPPMRLSYPWSETTSDGEYAYWINYECTEVPEWPLNELVYVYAGKERRAKISST